MAQTQKKGPVTLGGPAPPGELRVPWVSHLGPRLGNLERSSTLIALFQATVDPLTVATTFYLLAYCAKGQVTGLGLMGLTRRKRQPSTAVAH